MNFAGRHPRYHSTMRNQKHNSNFCRGSIIGLLISINDDVDKEICDWVFDSYLHAPGPAVAGQGLGSMGIHVP
jgi:hypothetical protein